MAEVQKRLILKILGTPLAKQSARFVALGKGQIRSFQKKEVVEKERNIAYDIKSQLPENFVLFDTPIFVNMILIFTPPASLPKKTLKTIEEGNLVPKDKKPDIDNLQKTLLDAMQGVVYTNDSRIYSMSASKFYGKIPQIWLEIIVYENIQN